MALLNLTKSKLLVACLAPAPLFVGCSESEFHLVPVSGTVTLDGQPLAGARVMLEPMKTAGGDPLALGPSSYGKTDATGRFELLSIDDDPGAVVGLHRVQISTYQAEYDAELGKHTRINGEQVPARYAAKGALQFQVPAGGTEAADFALESGQGTSGQPASAVE